MLRERGTGQPVAVVLEYPEYPKCPMMAIPCIIRMRGLGSPVPWLHDDWARARLPSRIGAGNGLTPTPLRRDGLLPLLRLHEDWARPSHISRGLGSLDKTPVPQRECSAVLIGGGLYLRSARASAPPNSPKRKRASLHLAPRPSSKSAA
jgi:hypothetical protein